MRFSLQTEHKSQASTYYTLNNAVRQSAIKLDENEKNAYTAINTKELQRDRSIKAHHKDAK